MKRLKGKQCHSLRSRSMCLADARIRLLLRAPCLSHPTLGASSTPIVARSLSRILTTYASQSASGLFHACWTQLRRITTCGQLLVLCHTARELSRHETEELFAIVLSLLKLHLGIFDFVGELVRSFESVAGLLGEYRGCEVRRTERPSATYGTKSSLMGFRARWSKRGGRLETSSWTVVVSSRATLYETVYGGLRGQSCLHRKMSSADDTLPQTSSGHEHKPRRWCTTSWLPALSPARSCLIGENCVC